MSTEPWALLCHHEGAQLRVMPRRYDDPEDAVRDAGDALTFHPAVFMGGKLERYDRGAYVALPDGRVVISYELVYIVGVGALQGS